MAITVVVLTPRLLRKEDLKLATAPNPATENVDVLGVGSMALTPVDAVFYSAFGSYANDAAAAAGGKQVGQLYYNTTNSQIQTRMS